MDAAVQGGSVHRNARALGAQRSRGWIAAVLGLATLAGAPVRAEEATRQQMQSLDEQVQEVKSDVLGIAAELARLEERLLYPTDSQVAVFVSLKQGEVFRLDSLSVQIDGAPVARHIYSGKELEALQKGGVQRIYTGNIPTGDHQLQVSIAGKRAGGSDLLGTESFGFRKDVEPKLVGITLSASTLGAASIQLGSW